MDMSKTMFTCFVFMMIIMIEFSSSVSTCDRDETDFYEMDEIMKTSEQIGFRPLFRHRQLMEERERIKQERLDKLNRRSNTKKKLIYGDFNKLKYQPQPPYTITYITWNKNSRDKQENNYYWKPISSNQMTRKNPYFSTNNNNYYYPDYYWQYQY